MQNLVTTKKDQWVRPWNKEKFDDLYNRDERFFSIVIKGALGWLTRNIVLYNRPLKHFVFNTGSTVMYMESNGYEYNESETTGEDWLYMEVPRCVCELGQLSIVKEDMSSQFVRGTYERLSSIDGQIKGYNAPIRRMPIEITLKCEYVLGNFNEALILVQELIDKLVFQQYFKIIYLGQIIQCSIEFPDTNSIQFDKIDMTQPNDKNKRIELDLKICTSYPKIDTRSEMDNSKIISQYGPALYLHPELRRSPSDIEKYRFQK